MAKKKKKAQPLSTKNAKSIRDKYGVKQPVSKEIKKSEKEIRAARRPIYALNKKIKEAATPYQKRKLKKELAAYKSGIGSTVSSMVSKRSDLKELKRDVEKAKKEKRVVSAELKRLDKEIAKAKKDKDFKLAASLVQQKINRTQRSDDLSQVIGSKKVRIKEGDIEAKPDEKMTDKGFMPFGPLTFWEAIKLFDTDSNSGAFDYAILNGRKRSLKGAQKLETILVAQEWFQTTGQDSHVLIMRYHNYDLRTVKYDIVIK